MIKLIDFHVDISIFAVAQNSNLKIQKTNALYIFHPYVFLGHFTSAYFKPKVRLLILFCLLTF